MALAILHFPSAAGRNVDLHCTLTQLLDLSAAYANYLQENVVCSVCAQHISGI